MRATARALGAGLILAGAALAADVTPPSAIPTFGLGVDVRQSRAIAASPGEVVLDIGYTQRVARSEFDDAGRKRPLRFNGEFVSQSVPLFLTYGLDRNHTVGFTTTAFNALEQQISLTNYQPGTTFAGIPLPTFETSMFRLDGSGIGDSQINLQRVISGEGRRTRKLLTLDIGLPTGRASSRGIFDLPPGKGNADATASIAVARELFPFRGFLKVGQELNATGRAVRADGRLHTIRAGNGANASAGISYVLSPVISFKNTFVYFTRARAQQDGQALPGTARSSLELRSGADLSIGKVSLSLEGLFPLTGRNIPRTQGFFTYAELRF